MLTNSIQAYTLFQPLYVITLTIIKASICFTLMRLATQKAVLWLIYGCLFVIVASAIITIGIFFNLCHPFSAAWTGVGHCADASVISSISYFISITAIVTDFTCAMIPSVILWNLQLDPRIKASVAAILSLGFMLVQSLKLLFNDANNFTSASSATLVRLRYIKNYTTTVDHICTPAKHHYPFLN